MYQLAKILFIRFSQYLETEFYNLRLILSRCVTYH